MCMYVCNDCVTGPAMPPVSPLIVPLLERWIEFTQSFEFTEFGEDEEASRTRRRYLFTIRKDPTRCLESSLWTARVKAAFKRHSPNHTATPPSLLRSAFITALRESTNDPEILESAAVAQKHSIAMQSELLLSTTLAATQPHNCTLTAWMCVVQVVIRTTSTLT